MTRRSFFSAGWLAGLFRRKKPEAKQRAVVLMTYTLKPGEPAIRTVHKIMVSDDEERDSNA